MSDIQGTQEEHPGLDHGPPPPVRSTPAKSRLLPWLLGGLVFAALGTATFLYLRDRSHAGSTIQPEPLADLPRLEGKSIVFSEAFAKRSGIKTSQVERTSLTPVVQVVGTVTFDSGYVSAAGTRIRGFVTKVFKVEGANVTKGEALAEIESTELGHAQAQVAVVAARRKAAERNAKREATLLASSLTTAREAELAKAEFEEQSAMLIAATYQVTALGGTAANKIGTYLVRAPINGTVVKRIISAGQSVESDLVAFRVADLDHLWIELSVFEREIGAVHIGDDVELIPTSTGDAKLRGKVAYVGEVIDPTNRTAEVRVVVENNRIDGVRMLRPGQSVVARLRPAGLTRLATTIAVSALTYVDGKATVFVSETDTKVAVREVKLGRTDGERQEILEGLKTGERVVSEGVFGLKSELFR